MEGTKQGIEYAKSTFNQQIQNANVNGFWEGYDEGHDKVEGLVKHYKAQIEMALQDKRSKWEGHGDICLQLSVSPSTCDSAVQSNPICLPPTTSSSTQTSLNLPSIANPTATPQISSPPLLPPLAGQPTIDVSPQKKLS